MPTRAPCPPGLASITPRHLVGQLRGRHRHHWPRARPFTGPLTTTLNAGLINIFHPATSSPRRPCWGTPSITLTAADTTINVSGGTYGSNTGYTDYLQSTFDIVRPLATRR